MPGFHQISLSDIAGFGKHSPIVLGCPTWELRGGGRQQGGRSSRGGGNSVLFSLGPVGVRGSGNWGLLGLVGAHGPRGWGLLDLRVVGVRRLRINLTRYGAALGLFVL